MKKLMGELATRWVALALGALLVAGLAGGALAVASGSDASFAKAGRQPVAATPGANDPTGDPDDENEAPVERFHGDGSTPCPLPEGVTLEGNWTHGDYVSAWARSDETKSREVAHSRCGKPMNASVKGENASSNSAKAKGASKAADAKAKAAAKQAKRSQKPAPSGDPTPSP